MNCELIGNCPFYNRLDSQAVSALKEVYCCGNPQICARRQVALAVGSEHVPPDLNPNHDYWVQDIISKIKNAPP
ncbi:MAG: hypothetical protein AB7E95_03635 [Kiritimatiellales bacterium]